MAQELSFRKGNKVRHVETIYNFWGAPIDHVNEVVTIAGRVRDDKGRFCKPSDCYAWIMVRDEKGVEFEVDAETIEVYNTIWDLTHDELCQLYGQIHIGSIYLHHYDNSFGIDSNQVYDFCEGFLSSIEGNNTKITPHNFANYCESVERY